MKLAFDRYTCLTAYVAAATLVTFLVMRAHPEWAQLGYAQLAWLLAAVLAGRNFARRNTLAYWQCLLQVGFLSVVEVILIAFAPRR